VGGKLRTQLLDDPAPVATTDDNLLFEDLGSVFHAHHDIYPSAALWQDAKWALLAGKFDEPDPRRCFHVADTTVPVCEVR
jgi:hypothetical protein